MLDPTLLLDKKDYIKIIEQAHEPISKGNLMFYILDFTVEKLAILNKVAATMDLKPFEVMPAVTLNNKIKYSISDYIFPPVTQWLRGFMDAEYVVTDSFHGSVFAIIFNKPFIAIGNKERGLTRFNSLFRLFGLENRLIYAQNDLSVELIKSPIDFDSVNKLRKEKRTKSLEFLKQALQ